MSRGQHRVGTVPRPDAVSPQAVVGSEPEESDCRSPSAANNYQKDYLTDIRKMSYLTRPTAHPGQDAGPRAQPSAVAAPPLVHVPVSSPVPGGLVKKNVTDVIVPPHLQSFPRRGLRQALVPTVFSSNFRRLRLRARQSPSRARSHALLHTSLHSCRFARLHQDHQSTVLCGSSRPGGKSQRTSSFETLRVR